MHWILSKFIQRPFIFFYSFKKTNYMKTIFFKALSAYHQLLSDAYGKLVSDKDLTTSEQDRAFNLSLYHQSLANFCREKYLIQLYLV